MPNAYNGAYGHSQLLVENVVVQMIAQDGSYYIASADCDYGTYVYDKTHGASLSLAPGDVISLWGKAYVYYGLDELDSVIRVRRERERVQLALTHPGP